METWTAPHLEKAHTHPVYFSEWPLNDGIITCRKISGR